ncbi:DNA-processing protein DprA [Algoriphagus sediminis]|uniref:DNA-processing protein DprA n=1 Tax=Algoriphagus sediminis TaxID=3057113 RepID=A0ABT7YAB7_9BACT|nr:DNA-processing protein DprA [Algoriphagus sediminis]MDN3203439.1 DNA-processing protein DprA [Algoriphagus sediminis]
MDSKRTLTPNEYRYFLALALAPKIGPSVFKAILAYSGSAKGFFEIPKGKVSKTPGVRPKLLSLRNEKDTLLKKADKVLDQAEKGAFTITTYLDEAFPQRLKLQEDGPVLLFSKGKSNLNFPRTIGIVGTRSATSYGKEATKKMIQDLSPYGATIISGLAYGIDIQAHRSAMENGLPTIAVLGSPINKIYPSIHEKVAEELQLNGALISEYPPGSTMVPGNFPARNRIIAGMSDALIVVEAAKKGGALITAEIAYSYDKPVFAVPGNLQSKYSEGCNHLIQKMKASIYTGPRDIAQALFWEEPGKKQRIKPSLDFSNRDPEEQKILKFLQENKEMDIDQLSYQTEIGLGVLASILLTLEFEGIVKSLPGKKYKLLV